MRINFSEFLLKAMYHPVNFAYFDDPKQQYSNCADASMTSQQQKQKNLEQSRTM
jgi:hypothetical protein